MSDKDASRPGRLRARTGGNASDSAAGRAVRFSTVLLVSERLFGGVADCAKVSPLHHLQCGEAGAAAAAAAAARPRPTLSKAAIWPETWRGNSSVCCCCGNLACQVVHGCMEGKRGPVLHDGAEPGHVVRPTRVESMQQKSASSRHQVDFHSKSLLSGRFSVQKSASLCVVLKEVWSDSGWTPLVMEHQSVCRGLGQVRCWAGSKGSGELPVHR